MLAIWCLRRNSVNLTPYKAYVRPVVEYADVAWDPFQTNCTELIDRVQNKTFGFIYNRYRRSDSIIDMNEKSELQWHLRRKINRLIFLHKSIIGLPYRLRHTLLVTQLRGILYTLMNTPSQRLKQAPADSNTPFSQAPSRSQIRF